MTPTTINNIEITILLNILSYSKYHEKSKLYIQFIKLRIVQLYTLFYKQAGFVQEIIKIISMFRTICWEFTLEFRASNPRNYSHTDCKS